MKTNKIIDERVIAQKRAISSDAFGIVYIGLLISILVQQLIYKAPFSQYAAEFILFIVAALYILARNIMVGNDLYGTRTNGQKMVVVNSLVCGLTSSIVIAVSSYQQGTGKIIDFSEGLLTLVIAFLVSTAASFVGFQLLYVLNRKRQNQLVSKLDQDE